MIELLIRLRDKLYSSYIKSKLGGVGKNFFCHRGLAIHNSKNIFVGDNVTIQRFSVLKAIPKLKLGNNVTISISCILDGDIEIGNKVVIGSFTHIISDTHDYKKDITKGEGSSKITIGNNVWIASGAKVLKGVTIGDNCVIGAGSVVNKNIPSNSMAVGIPAKVIRKLK